MLVAGDEFRRTQGGNNNAYCQDNEISWIDWNLVPKNASLVRFVRTLIHFRRNQPVFRRQQFLTGELDRHSGMPDVGWFGPLGTAVNWESDENSMICLLTNSVRDRKANKHGRDVLIMFNSDPEPREFLVPTICRSKTWKLFADTSANSPHDIYPDEDGPALGAIGARPLAAKSTAIYVAS